MANLQKSERFDILDNFKNICLYLNDIFTIDNRAFVKHIWNIYQTQFQLNKGNICAF